MFSKQIDDSLTRVDGRLRLWSKLVDALADEVGQGPTEEEIMMALKKDKGTQAEIVKLIADATETFKKTLMSPRPRSD